MKRWYLHDHWEMCESAAGEWLPVQVPGSVYADLIANGRLDCPYWKDREDQAEKRMEQMFRYRCTFTADQEQLERTHLALHFDGVDTLAAVKLNGVCLGHMNNMHREWEFDVKNVLREGENVLEVTLENAPEYIEQAYQKYGNIGNDDTFRGFMHLRKAHYMFGWDWGAHLPDAGIFRPVQLIGWDKGRIDSVYVRQQHGEEGVCLSFEPTLHDCEGEKVQWSVTVTAPDQARKTATFSQGETGTMWIGDPQLWWPNGLGAQPLYTVRVELWADGAVEDVWERRIGLRTMTMLRQKDAWGESFAHQVNGVAFFAMGADYIPEEHILGWRTKERTRQLLEDCKQANFNVIRVWGGGFYPDDWFYDLCDELGLVVWQDFMFACSVYELTPEFEENITREFIDNIKRLRHHPSLGLWCGNNEMEMFVDERCWVTKPSEVRDYLFMYERILPAVLKEYDPDTFYWPASPSSGGCFDHPNDPDRGDVHYWQVWHGNRPFSEYRKYYFRYLSEFGFQAFPSQKTIETITDDPKDYNPFSYIMEKHQRNNGANGKIMGYMQQMYRYPTDFSTFIYASQMLQADGIRYGVEHFRRNRGRCMGAVYWQLNDCWPVISWSSIDYCGRWKALHYYARRFFAPVLISCEEESWMTAEANMNRQHFTFPKSIRLNLSNETRENREVTVRWQLRDASAKVLREEECSVQVPALDCVWLERVELPEVDVFRQYVSYQALENGGVISEGTVIFSYPKYFRYEDPQLRCTVEGDEITVSASAYAKGVEIRNEQEDLVLSDNYFDLNGGSKTVRILRGKADGTLSLRSVYNI